MDEELRDSKGVRKQAYKRFKENSDFLPIQGNETRSIIEVIKRQFLETGPGRSRRKYESLTDFKTVIIQYFDYIADSNDAGAKLIPDVEGFCCYAGICRDTLNDWERTRPGEYSETIGVLKNAIASFKKQLALQGKIPPIVFATDFNNNHGYTQKQELSISPTYNPLGEMLTTEEIMKRLPSDIPKNVEYSDYECLTPEEIVRRIPADL